MIKNRFIIMTTIVTKSSNYSECGIGFRINLASDKE